MNVIRDRSLRRRLWWTALLVLIALGGAGLAPAGDRPHNPLQRPELTRRADRDAQPWIQQLAASLTMADESVVALSDHGDVLDAVAALNPEEPE